MNENNKSVYSRDMFGFSFIIQNMDATTNTH
jgi:hypothetical protein